MGSKRSLAAYPLLTPGLGWLLIFFFIPMAAMFKKSLETLHVNPDYSQTYTFDWNWGNYSDAAIADRLLSILPQLAAAVSEPLSKTEKIVMIGGGNGSGDGIGAHRVTKDVMRIVAELPEVLESLTGKRLDELVKALPKAGGAGEES